MKRNCATCGREFDGKPEKKYCDIRCRKKAERRREYGRAGVLAAPTEKSPEELEHEMYFLVISEPTQTKINAAAELWRDSEAPKGDKARAIRLLNVSEELRDRYDIPADWENPAHANYIPEL